MSEKTLMTQLLKLKKETTIKVTGPGAAKIIYDVENRKVRFKRVKNRPVYDNAKGKQWPVWLLRVARNTYKVIEGQHRLAFLQTNPWPGDPESVHAYVLDELPTGVSLGTVILEFNSHTESFTTADRINATSSPWIGSLPRDMTIDRKWFGAILRAFGSESVDKPGYRSLGADQLHELWSGPPPDDLVPFLEWVVRLLDPFRKRRWLTEIDDGEKVRRADDLIPSLSAKVLWMLLHAWRTNTTESRRAAVKRFHRGNQKWINAGRYGTRRQVASTRGAELEWVSRWMSLLNYGGQDKHRMILWNGEHIQNRG